MKCEKLSRFFVGIENFTFREMHVGEKSIRKIAAFLSSVIYYFGDLLKSASRALVQNKTFISL